MGVTTSFLKKPPKATSYLSIVTSHLEVSVTTASPLTFGTHVNHPQMVSGMFISYVGMVGNQSTQDFPSHPKIPAEELHSRQRKRTGSHPQSLRRR